MEDCYDDENHNYRCSHCAFSRENLLACANPNIWLDKTKDAYYKSRNESLTNLEKECIEAHLYEEV